MNVNYVQLIVLLLFVGISVLSWVIRKLQEQAQLREIQMERERRHLEMLRTGRPVADRPPPAVQNEADRLRELAARRQAQLQELRRRAQERAQAQTGPRDRPIVLIPGSSGPIVVQPNRPRPGAPAPARFPAPRTAPPGPRPIARPAGPVPDVRRRPTPPRRRAEPAPARPTPPRPAPEPTPASAITQAEIGAPPASVAGRRGGVPAIRAGRLGLEDWRRAVVMQEILSPPVSLREHPPGGWAFG